MLHQIEEVCPIGAHAALIVPPSWIIRVRRCQVGVVDGSLTKVSPVVVRIMCQMLLIEMYGATPLQLLHVTSRLFCLDSA